MEIIDTSALRSISRFDLDSILKRRRIVVSSTSIYELLCHLDEKRGGLNQQESYETAKGQMLKARNLAVLYDPFAYWANKIGADYVDPDRYLDPEAVEKLFDALDANNTLDDFYSDSRLLQNGTSIGFRDCSARARRVLEEEELKFVSTWNTMVAQIITRGITDWKEQINAGNAFWSVVSISIDASADFLTGSVLSREDQANELWHLAYCYIGYIISKFFSRMNDSGIANFSVDKNDTEDALICGYLDVRANDILISNDQRTIKALNVTFAAFDTHCPAKRKCRVMNAEDYKGLYL